MKCPYPDCKKDGITPPPNLKAARPYGYCQHCNRKSRAAVSWSSTGKAYVSYSPVSLPKVEDDQRKKITTIRLSDVRKAEIKAAGWKSPQEFMDYGDVIRQS